MSKLERQLDEVYGEERVVVRWRENEGVDSDETRRFLIREIDSHQQRIPLDLRSVDGAPAELIDLLIECQVYARSRGKVMSISNALPPMQEALRGQPRRSSVNCSKSRGDAGTAAKQILAQKRGSDEPASYDISKAKKIQRRKRGSRRLPVWHRYAYLAGAVLVGTAIVGIVEWYVIFHDHFSDVRVPSKMHEKQVPKEASSPGLRVWRDRTGRFEVEAVLTKLHTQEVQLIAADGRLVTVDIQELSEVDREYVRQLQSESPFFAQ